MDCATGVNAGKGHSLASAMQGDSAAVAAVAAAAAQAKMWQGMQEQMAKFYIASIVLALEYLHDQNLVSSTAVQSYLA